MAHCLKCNTSVSSNEQITMCAAGCKNQFHRICIGLSEGEFELLQKNKNIKWKCDQCLSFAQTKDVEAVLKLGAVATKQKIQLDNGTYYRKAASYAMATIVVYTLLILVVAQVGHISGWHVKHTTEDKYIKNESHHLHMIERSNWLAQPPTITLTPLELPVPHVMLLPTDTSNCNTQAACIFRLRSIQIYHIDVAHFGDIIYNFVIGDDGYIYEGRGWNFIGDHKKGYNDRSISVAYIGIWKAGSPSLKQLKMTELLLQEGLRQGKLASNYDVYTVSLRNVTIPNIQVKMFEAIA